jgi:hypothetical protein
MAGQRLAGLRPTARPAGRPIGQIERNTTAHDRAASARAMPAATGHIGVLVTLTHVGRHRPILTTSVAADDAAASTVHSRTSLA